MKVDRGSWSMEIINRLISDQVSESIHLEYKDSRALAKTDQAKKEISKDVSSFANSAGGSIIYGMSESKHMPIKLDQGSDINEVNKEWIENVINSTIRRRVPGILIHPIPLSEGKFVYVVEIPQSFDAPHMASDNRFYKRHNFQSVPMEEYEVRDVSRRMTSPDLYLKASLSRSVGDQRGWDVYKLNISIENKSNQMAEHYIVTAQIHPTVKVMDPSNGFLLDVGSPDKVEIRCVNDGTSKYPIWKGVTRNYLPSAYLQIPYVGDSKVDETRLIVFSVSAPLMDLKQFVYYFEKKDLDIVLVEVDPLLVEQMKRGQSGSA